MNRLRTLIAAVLLLAAITIPANAAEWYAAPGGKPDAQGTRDAPWDLDSALSGQQEIAPGDTLWLLAGTYKYPDRKLGSPGYVVRMAGEKDKPITVRGVPDRRVTIDGGLSVQRPSTWLRIRDLEILVSENLSMSRTLDEPGSHPKSYNRPWGGLHIHSGTGCKYINLVIHDNAQGISWWKGSTDSEVHGCIIYDNGWKAPDRGHGHAIYTQNQDGTKTISDCIMTGGFGYTMHAYGSSRAYVDNYLVEGNICYDAGPFLIGGGRPSRNIRAEENYLYNVSMRVGYSAPHNEDCQIRHNVILGGGMQINNYKRVVKEGNLVLDKNDPRPKDADARVVLRPNRYDPNRAHVAVFNWAKTLTVGMQPGRFLEPGDKYRLMDPRDFFGKPVVAGTFDGKPIRVPLPGEFAAFVLLKEPND
ncbi:MAG: right-handed parallel beta-helix repeat-containing protein [Planctomycetota bacterium]|jgi:hypothetical protein